MSFWDRYLAPGDIRQRQQVLQAQAQKAAETAPLLPRTTPTERVDAATRARRQNGFLFGGVAFAALSMFITRRSISRKIIASPSTFTPSNAPPTKAQGGLDAVEALSYATMNVFSFGLIALGAGMKIFDIGDLEDMRDKVRKGIGFDVYGGDSNADEEMEQWVADILNKKDNLLGLREGVADKLAELDRIEAEKKRLQDPNK